MQLYYFPPSSYSQKALMGIYEKQVQVDLCLVPMFDPVARADLGKVSPMGKVPVLILDDGTPLPESSILLEYLDTHFDTGTRLFPTERDVALQARLYDRWFDLYVNEPMTVLFHHGRRPPEQRDERAMEEARLLLDRVYPHLDRHLAIHEWAAGDVITVAECAAAPALRYCEMVYPFERYCHLTNYWRRLEKRPSYVRVMAEAEPFLNRLLGK